MQFKQFFIALCALILIFSACKKDETPILPEMTGLWEAVTFINSDCDDPLENSTTDASELTCIPDAVFCSEYNFDFKEDGVLAVEVIAIVFGQDISDAYTGTYTVLSENEVELCYDNECVTASLNDGQLTVASPDEESGCLISFVLEKM